MRLGHFIFVFVMVNGFQICFPFQWKIPVGAIFDWEDKAAKTGFLFGITQFNSDPEQSFQLSAVVDVIDVADSFKLASSICSKLSRGVFMLVGTRKFASNDIVQSYSHTFHIPYVSASLSDVDPRMKQGYQLNMKPSHTKALVDIIIHFGWRNFHYVYDSEEGLFSIEEIIRICNTKKYHVTVRMRRIQDINDAHEDLRALDKLDEANNSTQKYILIDLANEPGYSKIMKQVREVGMNKEGYHYILGTLDFLNLDMERYQHGGVNITGFQLVNYTSAFVKNFLKKWNRLDANIWPGAENNAIHIDAALIYDAITVISKTLKILISKSPSGFKHTFRRGDIYNYNRTKGVPCNTEQPVPWMHGEALMKGMKSLHFDGVTGNIEFDEFGLRKNYKFDVYNVGLQYGPEKIGEWSPTGGVYSHLDDDKSAENGTTASKVYIVTSIEDLRTTLHPRSTRPPWSTTTSTTTEDTHSTESETTSTYLTVTQPDELQQKSQYIRKDVLTPDPERFTLVPPHVLNIGIHLRISSLFLSFGLTTFIFLSSFSLS